MEDVTFTITKEKLEKAIQDSVDDVFKLTYSNPFTDAIKETLRENNNVFKEMFSKMLTDIMAGEDFKTKLGDIAMKSMFENMMSKR